MQKILSLCFIIFVIPVAPVFGMSDVDKFRDAVEKENIPEIKDLITTKKVGVDYYPLNMNYDTALLIAVRKNNIKMAEELLRLDADINRHSNREETPLLLAVKNDNLAMVQLLLNNSKDIDRIVNRFDKDMINDDKRPLMLAVMNGSLGIIKAILNELPKPDFKKTDADPSALDYAEKITGPQKNEIVGLLKTAQKQYALYQCALNPFEDCADSNFTPDVLKQTITNPRRNPLFVAINKEGDANLGAVKQFIEKGINVNQTVRGGITPLMEAVRYKRFPIIQLFLENGADPLVKNTEGKTALDILRDTTMLKDKIVHSFEKKEYDDAVAALTEAEDRWKKAKVQLPGPELLDSLQNLTQQLRALEKALQLK